MGAGCRQDVVTGVCHILSLTFKGGRSNVYVLSIEIKTKLTKIFNWVFRVTVVTLKKSSYSVVMPDWWRLCSKIWVMFTLIVMNFAVTEWHTRPGFRVRETLTPVPPVSSTWWNCKFTREDMQKSSSKNVFTNLLRHFGRKLVLIHQKLACCMICLKVVLWGFHILKEDCKIWNRNLS